MTTGSRFIEVLREQALLLPARSPRYRADSVNTIVAVIGEQKEGGGPTKRRQQVLKLVRDLGTRTLSSGGGD